MKKLVYLVLRYGLGLLFVTTAIGKLLDNRGFAAVLFTYQLLPEPPLLALALAVSLSELLLGAWIWRGYRAKECALAALLINISYLVLAIVTNARGLQLPNCGCFGVFWARPMTPMTIFEDFILAALTFAYWKMTK